MLEVDLDAALDDDGMDLQNLVRSSGYTRCADDEDVQVAVEKVEALLAERHSLQLERRFVEADKIKRQLFKRGIRVDDKRQTWSSRRRGQAAGGYSFRGDVDELDPAFIEMVESILARRARAKKARDWVVADALRDELMIDHGVQVLDREHVWRCTSRSYSRRGQKAQ